MGRNILSFTDTEYHLANGVVRFSLPNDGCAKAILAYLAGATHVSELDLEFDRRRSRTPSLRVRIKLNGKEVMALLDTGATTLVTAQAARRVGVGEAQMTPSGAIYGAGRGSARSEAIASNRLRVGDFALDDADLLLGIDFFLSHRIYVSKQQSKIFITYNGGTVFALNRGDGTGALPESAEPSASGTEAAGADQLARRNAAFAARQDYERALADLDRAIELEPTSAAHLAQRGRHPRSAQASRTGVGGLRQGARARPGAGRRPMASGRAAATRREPRRCELRPRSDRQGDRSASAASPADVRSLPRARAACAGPRAAEPLARRSPSVATSRSTRVAGRARCSASSLRRLWTTAMRRSMPTSATRSTSTAAAGSSSASVDTLGDAAQGESDLEAARKAQADIDLKVTRAGLTAEQSAQR